MLLCGLSFYQDAQAAVVPLLVPLILFSGYLIPYAQIPTYFRFLYDMSFFQHAIAILEINQFKDVHFTDCPGDFWSKEDKWKNAWDDDQVRTSEVGGGGKHGVPPTNVSWTCHQAARLIANATSSVLNLNDSSDDDDDDQGFLFAPGGVVDICSSSSGQGGIPTKSEIQDKLPCFVDGKALLKELHIDDHALGSKFFIIAIYVAAALLLAYLSLFKSLKSVSFSCGKKRRRR
jgi:hypothetical protein